MTPEALIKALPEPRRTEFRRVHELIRAALPGREVGVARDMVVYGPYRYRYATGREGESALVSLASQKRHLSLYVNCVSDAGYLPERYAERLGKVSVGKSCIRFRRADDLDPGVLRELLAEAHRIGPAAAA